MPNYRLDLAYDGAGFHGLARQPQQRTVQGEVEAAITRALGTTVSTVAAGRTDAGVHARHQVMSFSVDVEVDCERLLRSLQSQLYPEIAPSSLAQVEDEFDARHSAIARTYKYRIDNQRMVNPWSRQAVWHIPEQLDVDGMDFAVQDLIGEHDFAAFCRASSAGGTVRHVEQASWSRDEPLVVLSIRARSFCHQMVRSIVGLSVEIGRRKKPPKAMAEVLASRVRGHSGQLAPAAGLILWEVSYEA
jgi:tRNA pseudouridine38-40 synthase